MDQLAYAFYVAGPGKKVVNRTCREGIYRVDMSFHRATNEPGEGPNVTTALRDLMGLQLQSTKEKIDSVVVGNVERPASN